MNDYKMSEETITISKNEYDRLLDRVDFLACLIACGVDNWQGYGDAYELYENAEEEESE